MKPGHAFITGWSGFVGRHFYKYLTELGWTVDGCDIRDFWQSDARVWMRNNMNDRRSAYDLVIHCAFHVGGREAIDGVNTNVAKNLELDGLFFDWAVRSKQKNVIYYSSSAAYPVCLQNFSFAGRLCETDIVLDPDAYYIDVPDAGYGWAKLTAERHLVPMARAHGVNVSVLRPFSGYGEDQDLTYPFPAIVKRAHEHVAGQPFEVWGPPQQARDWVHITDVVRASFAVATQAENETVNICTGRKTAFRDLAELCLVEAGKVSDIVFNEDKPTGVLVRVGDPTKMLSYYEPKITIEQGVASAFQRLRG